MGFYMAAWQFDGLGRDDRSRQFARDSARRGATLSSCCSTTTRRTARPASATQLRAAEPRLLVRRSRTALRGRAQAIRDRGTRATRSCAIPRSASSAADAPASCAEVQGVYNTQPARARFSAVVTPAHGLHDARLGLQSSAGQCINVCPTAAFLEKNTRKRSSRPIADPKKHVVVQTAPRSARPSARDSGCRPARRPPASWSRRCGGFAWTGVRHRLAPT